MAVLIAALRKARTSPVWPLALAVVGVPVYVARVEPYVRTLMSGNPVAPDFLYLTFFADSLILIAAYAVIRQRRTVAVGPGEPAPPAA